MKPCIHLYECPPAGKKEKRELSRKLTLGLLQNMLEKSSGRYPLPEIRILTREQGKPYLPDFPSVHFNASDSGNFIAIGISSRNIGVDIEVIRPRNYRDILARWFAPQETEPGTDFDSPYGLNHFVRLWTCKESLLKWVGCGLGKEMNLHRICWRQTPCHTGKAPQAYALEDGIMLDFHSLLIQNGRVLPWNAGSARCGDLVLTICAETGSDYRLDEHITLLPVSLPEETS